MLKGGSLDTTCAGGKNAEIDEWVPSNRATSVTKSLRVRQCNLLASFENTRIKKRTLTGVIHRGSSSLHHGESSEAGRSQFAQFASTGKRNTGYSRWLLVITGYNHQVCSTGLNKFVKFSAAFLAISIISISISIIDDRRRSIVDGERIHHRRFDHPTRRRRAPSRAGWASSPVVIAGEQLVGLGAAARGLGRHERAGPNRSPVVERCLPASSDQT